MTEQQLSQYPEEVSRTTEPEEIWRNEVQDRLARYTRRRGRRIEGAYSMRFPFPAEEIAETVPVLPEVASAPAEVEPVPHPEVHAGEHEVAPEIEVAAETKGEASAPEVLREGEELVLHAPPADEDDDAAFVD